MDQIEDVRRLGDKEVAILNAELDRQRKNAGIAYLLLFFFGIFGAHRFYLGRWLSGLMWFPLFLVGYLMMFGGLLASAGSDGGAGGFVFFLGFLALATLFVMFVLDLVTIPRQVQKRENALRAELVEKLSGEGLPPAG